MTFLDTNMASGAPEKDFMVFGSYSKYVVEYKIFLYQYNLFPLKVNRKARFTHLAVCGILLIDNGSVCSGFRWTFLMSRDDGNSGNSHLGIACPYLTCLV